MALAWSTPYHLPKALPSSSQQLYQAGTALSPQQLGVCLRKGSRFCKPEASSPHGACSWAHRSPPTFLIPEALPQCPLELMVRTQQKACVFSFSSEGWFPFLTPSKLWLSLEHSFHAAPFISRHQTPLTSPPCCRYRCYSLFRSTSSHCLKI